RAVGLTLLSYTRRASSLCGPCVCWGTVVAVPQQFFSPISTRSFRAEAPAQSRRIPMKAFWVSGRNSPEGLVALTLDCGLGEWPRSCWSSCRDVHPGRVSFFVMSSSPVPAGSLATGRHSQSACRACTRSAGGRGTPFPAATSWVCLFLLCPPVASLRQVPSSFPRRQSSARPVAPSAGETWSRAQRRPCVDRTRSEEHTSELQSPCNLVCR